MWTLDKTHIRNLDWNKIPEFDKEKLEKTAFKPEPG